MFATKQLDRNVCMFLSEIDPCTGYGKFVIERLSGRSAPVREHTLLKCKNERCCRYKIQLMKATYALTVSWKQPYQHQLDESWSLVVVIYC